MSDTRVLLIGGLDAEAVAVGKALQQGASVQVAGEGAEVAAASGVAFSLAEQADVVTGVNGLRPFNVAVLWPGWRAYAPFLETEAEDWDDALSHNFERIVYAAQACAKRLIAQGQGGRLIFVTGVTALMPFAGASAQGSTLAALHAIARMAAVDLAPHGITVNVVAPGWLAGETFNALDEAAQAHVRAGIPLARPARPDEIASLITFLASEGGQYVTGAILPVDGGYTLTRSDGREIFRE